MARMWIKLAMVCMAMGMAMAALECGDAIEKLAPCLAFIEMQASAPTAECCKGLLSVHLNKPACLCLLLQSSSSPPAGVNTSVALMLPAICKVNTDPSRCPAFLGEPVAAPEDSPTTSTASSSSSVSGKETSLPNSSSSQLVPWIMMFVGSGVVQLFGLLYLLSYF